MASLGYYDVFPEKWATDVRTSVFESGDEDDPLVGGMFLFNEYYCTDLNCDCQQVLVKVLRVWSEETPPENIAVFSYSWNLDNDLTRMIGGLDLPNPLLDPFHSQASYAAELMEFWNDMFERDRAYAARIRRHYREIRATVGQKGESLDSGDLVECATQTGHDLCRPETGTTRSGRLYSE